MTVTARGTLPGMAVVLAAALLAAPPARASDWKPVAGPLLTRWAKDVSPDKVWPEYPRPQLVRPRWVNLNGLWDYAIVTAAPVPDASGRKHEGSAVGAPKWRPDSGPAGGPALEFNGTADAVRVPRLVADDFTISFRLKTTQRAGRGAWYAGAGLVDGEVAGVTDDFGTALVGDAVAFGVGKPDTTITSTTAVNDGRWHHVAAVRTRATGAIRLFVDGKQEAAGKGGTQSLTAPAGLMLGMLQTGIHPFRGSLADVRLYDRALSAGEVAALARAAGRKTAAPGLVGWWRFDEDWKKDRPRVTYHGKILVPFPVESALSGVRRPLMPWQLLYYRRTFTAPDLSGGKRLLLHFGAVDWEVTVYVNGKLVGKHRGGYDAFTLDITDAVRPGENEIVVVVFDPTGGTRGKQNLDSFFHPGGIFYTPCSGIWQTVWLEAVPARRIDELRMVPDVDAGVLRLTVVAKGPGPAGQAEAVAGAGGREVARARGRPGSELVLRIPKARLWSPDDPFLYDLKVKLGDDEVTSYFGMRKVSLGKDARGVTRILLNGKFVFQVGVLDQGYWPDGIYTAPTDEALRFDVAMMRKLGLNMARKHVKVEPQRWYYWCDKLGLLVWQDMPSGDISKDNTAKHDGVALTPGVGRQFEAELRALVEQHRNHPCIIMWVVFNEGWGQHDTVRMTRLVKEMDPSRLVSNASGWFDRHCGDVVDLHSYPGPGSPRPEPARAAVLGEFGGLGLAVRGHTWTNKTWGYRGTGSRKELTDDYVKLWRKGWQLRDGAGLSAAVYTQWTDVETECNGLLTYDRKVVKVDARRAADAHRGRSSKSEARNPKSETRNRPFGFRASDFGFSGGRAMRKVTFGVANSLDNFIARPNGAVDWLYWSDDVSAVMAAFWRTIDTVVMGRKTYEVALRHGGGAYPGVQNYVFSRTMTPSPDRKVEIVADDAATFLRDLKARPGKGICVMGGGELARALFEAELIDEIGLNIHPVLLGSGVPLFHRLARQVDLELLECRTLQGGCVLVTYRVKR
jgi:dihydrofolate reductase